MLTRFLVTVLALMAMTAAGIAADEIQAMLGDVRDWRGTHAHFGGLQIEIKLMGEDLYDARFIRTTVHRCVDETGRDLTEGKMKREGFDNLGNKSGQNATVVLPLNNPSRKAAKINELNASIELFVPKKDAEAVVRIDSLQKSTGTTLDAPALKAAGVEVAILTKEQYDARREEQYAEADKRSKRPIDEQTVRRLRNAIGDPLGTRENDVMFRIRDPNHKLIGLEFQDESGKMFESRNRNSLGAREDQIVVYKEETNLPDTTRLVLYLATPKALLTVPVQLKDIPLP